MRIKLYKLRDLDAPETIKNAHVITTIRIVTRFGHDEVSVWNRGGKAGLLCVLEGDGPLLAERLFHDTPFIIEEEPANPRP